jgi:phosphoglycerate-specific signal transduction histidine kinase
VKKIKEEFQKKIFIDMVKEKNGFVSILIADNGNGFTLPTSQIIKPFITAKDDGMGLGLHITNQIMKVLKGDLKFPGKGEYNIPKEFENGAVVVFQFKLQQP